jgi:hypothetical protein
MTISTYSKPVIDIWADELVHRLRITASIREEETPETPSDEIGESINDKLEE